MRPSISSPVAPSVAGKTILIDLFLQSIAPRIRRSEKKPEQLIIFDAKCDIVPRLEALGYKPDDPNVWLLNPYDARCAVWNIAEAVQEPGMARYLASLLVPKEEKSSAPYFANAAREIVYAVIIALNTRRGVNWTFRDLLCALDSPEHIAGVTANDEHAQRHARQFSHDDAHFPGILSSIATRLGPFSQVAALWHKHPNPARPPFRIKEFLSKPGVLVLGYDPVLNDSFWPLNAMLLKALTNEILRQPNTKPARHWFILDEFRAMEKLDCIVDLLNRGRSKGAAVVLGIQSVEGMESAYRVEGANEILGLCGNKTFLRSGSAHTANWAEGYFGKLRRTELNVTEQWSRGGYSFSAQRQVQDRPLFLASMFLGLPYPEKGVFQCINDIPYLNAATLASRPFSEVISWVKEPGTEPQVSPRTDYSQQKLDPWTPAEEAMFCRADAGEESRAAATKEKGRAIDQLPRDRTRKEPDDNPPAASEKAAGKGRRRGHKSSPGQSHSH